MTAPDQQPLTPGSVWRSRGTAGHNRYEVRITKISANGRVTFMRVHHRQGLGERRNTAAEPAFRRQYEPVKVEPVSEAQLAAEQLEALRVQGHRRQVVAARTNGPLLDRLGLDPEDLIQPIDPEPVVAVAEPEPEPIPPAPAEAEAFPAGEPPPPAAVAVLESYLDAGLAALRLLDEQLAAKDAAIAALTAEREVLVAQKAAIAASLETLSQQAPVAPAPQPSRHS